jgi:iron complex transport system substrate-binding protein
MRLRNCASVFFAGIVVLALPALANEIRMVDDAGRHVILKQPARRMVSLAPHITELLFAAGAGDRVVGTIEYSTYPEAAKRIAVIGDSAQLDLERIIALKPDLLVVWQHGNAQRQLERLLDMGIPAFYNQPSRLADIAHSIEQLGRLAGTEAVARAAARDFRARANELGARYAGRSPVTLFYQLWEQPLMTVNGEHLISDLMRVCGARNVFAGLKPLVPRVSTEAVLAANPEAMLGAVFEPPARGDLDNWKTWSRLTAVARGNFILIHTDLLNRPTPRILEGTRHLCEGVEAARARRPG